MVNPRSSSSQTVSLNLLVNPHCKSANPVNAPLLIYRPGYEPNLVFSPQKTTSEELDREIAVILLRQLSESVGETWQDEWVKDMAVLPKPALPVLFTQGLEAAQMFDQNIKVGQEFSEEESRQLPELVLQFVGADSWGETRRVLEAYHELLTDNALLVLDFLIHQAQEESNQDAEKIFRQHQTLLHRCREVEVEDAFAELTTQREAEADPLFEQVMAFIQAESWDESQRMVEDHL